MEDCLPQYGPPVTRSVSSFTALDVCGDGRTKTSGRIPASFIASSGIFFAERNEWGFNWFAHFPGSFVAATLFILTTRKLGLQFVSVWGSKKAIIREISNPRPRVSPDISVKAIIQPGHCTGGIPFHSLSLDSGAAITMLSHYTGPQPAGS